MSQSVAYYARLLGRYWGAADSVPDFLRLTRIRLAQSKVGHLVCPNPVRSWVNIKPYGGKVELRSHTTDISVNDEILVSDGYDMLRRHIKEPVDTIVDLGANTGLAARWLLRVFPGSRLLSVEPEPGNVGVLRHNVEGWPVHVAPVAVGASVREAVLFTNSGEHGFTIVGAPEAGEQSVTVAVRPLEQLLDEGGIDEIDLLKADIEGAEAELFAHCRAWIAKVDWLLIECHHGFGLDDLLALVRDQGAAFDVIERHAKSSWGHEVGLLRRSKSQTQQA